MSSLPLRTLALGDLTQELDNTRKVLERIPFDRDDWAPQPKSFSIRKLGVHLANLPFWGTAMLGADHFDFRAPLPASRAAAVRGFLVSHLIHHRGQLTVYLRLLDIPVPGLYGASADEK